MTSKSRQVDTLEHLLPTPQLAEKWSNLLADKRAAKNSDDRERQFLFGHGWLRALVDAGLVTDANLSDLRELLIKA